MSADTLRVLTVRQPWAWAILHGGKDVENRVRSLGPYRGPVAIHAATHPNPGPWWAAVDPPFGSHPGHDPENWGAVIGVVDLVSTHLGGITGCHPDPGDPHRLAWCSAWAIPDRHHLELANPRPLTTPIPARGRLGLWRPDPDLTAAILAALPKETDPDA